MDLQEIENYIHDKTRESKMLNNKIPEWLIVDSNKYYEIVANSKRGFIPSHEAVDNMERFIGLKIAVVRVYMDLQIVEVK